MNGKPSDQTTRSSRSVPRKGTKPAPAHPPEAPASSTPTPGAFPEVSPSDKAAIVHANKLIDEATKPALGAVSPVGGKPAESSPAEQQSLAKLLATLLEAALPAGKSVRVLIETFPSTVNTPASPLPPPVPLQAEGYLTTDQARAYCGLERKGRSTWYRFLRQHSCRLRRTRGGMFHRDDLDGALKAERLGR